ncbi:MAG: type II toxin-antitoxin system VapC family toxin [Methylococcaceae bacterium]
MGRLIYLLDTNSISEPIKEIPNQAVVDKIYLYSKNIAIASITVYEMMRGAYLLPESKKRTKILDYNNTVLTQFSTLSYTKEAAQWHSRESARLQRIGKSAPFIDSQIAAIAKVNNLILVTRNTADFENFTDIQLENWFIPN